ncbi:hypothetical protein F511_26313 [Dorcoceras hygrometricum]|uniref:NB-ARC domain-containing protein n=1 Tax=Dorcoceras hygrometricum TaxID=472368 RepID=A0A2Z7BP08_9LAMI|nr:hypothetical protein F511_26313 [Dorcoceras hygrometricum]
MKIKESDQGVKITEQPKKYANVGSFIGGASSSKNNMVGFDEDLIQVMETLTGDESNLQILSVVGMGGIGKTTLARHIFSRLRLPLLDEVQSWSLFCDKVFGKSESCPLELEEIGKTIVRNCGGLPLAIAAISGLLAKFCRTVEYWKSVANDTYEALNMGGDGFCFEILSLSYRHLPVHLKPCFLYMAIFREDSNIRVSMLVELWVAEAIVKPIRFRSLEEVAEDNLKDLIDRNLIQVRDYGSRNNIKSCTIHDLFRELCLKEAQNERPVSLPTEIWEMPHLRHLKTGEGDFYLPDPPSTNSKNGRRDIFELKNLRTLSTIRNFRCTNEVLRRIPNLKKLGITYKRFSGGFGWDYYEVYNLAYLCNLESFILNSPEKLPQNFGFPRSLKKLTLQYCEVSWGYLTVVGSLPHLEALNLMHYAVVGREWNPVEGQFLKLKSLRIVGTDLEEWVADSTHFPNLEKLQLNQLRHLKEIPYGIGEIGTLRSISLVWCISSANASAEKIQEEQQQLGNSDLQVRIISV